MPLRRHQSKKPSNPKINTKAILFGMTGAMTVVNLTRWGEIQYRPLARPTLYYLASEKRTSPDSLYGTNVVASRLCGTEGRNNPAPWAGRQEKLAIGEVFFP